MHGHGIFFLGDGSTYEGTFVHGEMQGMGLRRWPDGTTYSGEFCRGEMHGEGTFIASSGKRIGPDGLPDATPLVFRDAVVPEETNGVGDTMPGSSPVVVVIAPPIKLLPQFQVACCVDKATASSNNPSPEVRTCLIVVSVLTNVLLVFHVQGSTSSDVVVGPTVVVEESRHGIRMSLFQGKSPVDAAREAAAAAAAFDADSKDKRKKSTVVEAVHGESATSAAPVPLLMAFEDPTTQANVVEMIVWTLNGVATVPSIQLPVEAATTCGEYFLQFDSIIDPQGMPSAYFGFTIVRGDADLSFGAAGDKGKKDALKKK
ncbi:hypothetical protein DYB34_006010 [Aphanomyces astaci]|uniref:MORN repeat-containing protein 5 n=1 Tax=Aphanomyces astaci TaxID=112090 RepID=A0A418BY77_APHAT|nr:hypothetical protein DYB34_006010 [Aphanomyces astaci]